VCCGHLKRRLREGLTSAGRRAWPSCRPPGPRALLERWLRCRSTTPIRASTRLVTCDQCRTCPLPPSHGPPLVMSVLLETSLGDIVIDLEVDACPKTCENFLKLCKVYYYNLNAFFNGVCCCSCVAGIESDAIFSLSLQGFPCPSW